MSREQYGSGTLRDFTDKRNGNRKYLCIIHINGKKRTKMFSHDSAGKKEALNWLAEMKTLKTSVENDEIAKLKIQQNTITTYLKEKESEKQAEQEEQEQHITLKQAISSYIENYYIPRVKEKQIKEATYKRVVSTFGRIPASLLSMDITEIKKDTVQINLNKMLSAEYANEVNDKKQPVVSAREANKALSLIKAVMLNELDNERIKSNPLRRLKRRPVENKEVQIYSFDEIKRMMGAIYYIEHSPVYSSLRMDLRLMFTLLITTGCRIGEILGLKFSKISLEKGHESIRIDQTLDSHWYDDTKKEGLRIHSPKTDRSKFGGKDGVRTIPIVSKRVIRMLKNIMPTNDADKNRLIFETTQSTPTSYHNFYKRWQSICIETARKCPHCGTKRPTSWTCESCGTVVNRRGKICPKCKQKRPHEWTCPTCGTTVREIQKHPHTARHTVCTIMIQMNIPINNVAAYLGNSPEIALRTYTHASANFQEEIREMVEKVRNKNKMRLEVK